MSLQKCCFTWRTFNDLFSFLERKLSKLDLKLMSITTKYIWLHRFKLVYEGKFHHPIYLAVVAKMSLKNFHTSISVHQNKKSNWQLHIPLSLKFFSQLSLNKERFLLSWRGEEWLFPSLPPFHPHPLSSLLLVFFF